jgi:hypothetical protein
LRSIGIALDDLTVLVKSIKLLGELGVNILIVIVFTSSLRIPCCH